MLTHEETQSITTKFRLRESMTEVTLISIKQNPKSIFIIIFVIYLLFNYCKQIIHKKEMLLGKEGGGRSRRLFFFFFFEGSLGEKRVRIRTRVGGHGGDQEEAEKTLSPRLVVDEKQKRLVYAVCSRVVVVLLSFLLIPVGAVVRLTCKNSGLGCMDALYQSVENMSPTHFRTPAWKHLLRRPRNAWCFRYEGLK